MKRINKFKLFSLVVLTYVILGCGGEAFANYSYTVYAGSASSSFAMQFKGVGDDHCYINAYYSGYPLGPSPNPVYAPSGMAAGRIVLSYKNNSSYHSSYWNYATIAYIDLYLVNNDGSEVYWQKISFQPWYIAEGNTVVLGDYYLGANYRGVRIGSLTAYCSNYMTASATASESGVLNFDFYNLAFAPTEGQFNNLSNNVINAYNAANSANTAATGAQTAANTAATKAASALTAANSANTNASNAYSSVYNTNGNTITAVRDAGGTVLAEARQAKTNSENAYNTAQTVNTKIDSLSNAVTNIQNNLGADTAPPSVKITTVSGALATSAASIRAVINASDNVSAFFEYSLDGAWYQTLPQDGVISLPVNSPGSNLITVWVKDEAGNIGRDSITIRKL